MDCWEKLHNDHLLSTGSTSYFFRNVGDLCVTQGFFFVRVDELIIGCQDIVFLPIRAILSTTFLIAICSS